MNKIAIVYWSGTGNTEQMANAIAEGARGAGSEVEVLPADGFTARQLDGYQVVAFGCPAMGSEELEDSVVEPMFAGLTGSLSGRKVALFGSYGWGDGQWLRDWADRCTAVGAVVLDHNGLRVNEAPDAEGIASCNALGAQLANW